MARNALLRIGNIVMAEIEDVLGRIENPRKMVNQMLMDMEQAFDQAVAEVSRQSRMRRSSSDDFTKRSRKSRNCSRMPRRP